MAVDSAVFAVGVRMRRRVFQRDRERLGRDIVCVGAHDALDVVVALPVRRDAVRDLEPGIAAHVLLAMGLCIAEVNSSGHPDIVAQSEHGIVRVEVETDTRGIGTHLPEPDDFAALAARSQGDSGFFAVLICSPFPKWIILDSYKLENRKTKLPLPLLDALRNKEQSREWSKLFLEIILENQSQLRNYSFEWLVRLAIAQKCLILH